MLAIAAVVNNVRDENALCSVYIDTTQATDTWDIAKEIAHQFKHHHVVGEPDMVAALINGDHALHALAVDACLRSAKALCDVHPLEYMRTRPWVNFYNSASSVHSQGTLAEMASRAKVGTPKFQPDLTKASTPSGIRVRIGTEAKSKDLYLEGETTLSGDYLVLDLLNQVRNIDLQCLVSSGTGLLMNVNGCRTLITGDNLAEFGHSDDPDTQRWQKAVTDRLTAALKAVSVSSIDIALRMSCAEAGTISFAVWFESDLTPNV